MDEAVDILLGDTLDDKSLDEGTAGIAGQFADKGAELEVCTLQSLFEAIDLTGACLDDAFAIPGNLAQFTLGLVWDEVGLQKTMLKKIGDPLGVLLIGLAAGNRLHVLRVDDHGIQAEELQHIEDCIQ